MRAFLSLLFGTPFVIAKATDPNDLLVENIVPAGENIALCRVSTNSNATLLEEINHFFAHLFSPEGFPPRWYCGEWSEFHGWLYILSDLTTGLAYLTIPLILFFVIRKRRNNLPFQREIIFFVLFIFFCGLTHLLDVVIFWEPLYRFSASLRFATAVISVATVIVMLSAFPRALQLKSPYELKRQVEKRTEELNAANRELENINHMMSHDLKAPLANIKTLTDMLRNQIGDNDQEAVELVDYLEISAKKSLDKIQEMADLSRKRKGQYSEIREVNVEKEISDVLDLIQGKGWKETGQFKIDVEVQKLHIRPTSFRSILQNLLSNAIKFQETGRESKIEIMVRRLDDKIQLIVKDNGVGIDVETAEDRLFRIFERINENKEGTGIGLYLVKELVEKEGGTISVESKEGVGSSFIILFPYPSGGQ